MKRSIDRLFLQRSGALRRTSQAGQVMVLFAISLLVLMLMVGIAIDGGFGLLQYRQAQNAADFAAEAGAKALYPQCTDLGTPVTGQEMVYIINALIANNSPSTNVATDPYGWTGYYLNALNQPLTLSGHDIPVYDTSTGTPVDPPTGACGVHLNVTPQWPPFIEQIMGVTHLQTAAGAAARNPASAGGPQTSIVALAENGAHDILMAGDGKFEVQGTIYDNANGCLNYNSTQQIPNCSSWGGINNPDILDGKQSGTMYDWGTLEYSTIVNSPWDGCFGSPSPDTKTTTVSSTWPPANPPSPLPTDVANCSANNTKVYTDGWQSTGKGQITSTPSGLPPAPTPSNAGCGLISDGTSQTLPGTVTEDGMTFTGGVTNYFPGVYHSPLVITGNAVFMNCSQAYGVVGADPPAPGVFYFDQGLAIRPASGKQVAGQDILLATQDPLPNGTISTTPGAPGYQNVGDGEPAIGLGSSDCTRTSSGETCTGPAGTSYGCPNGPAGTNCNSDANALCGNSVCFKQNPVAANSSTCSPEPNSCLGQGLNDALQIGGNGTVTLTAPQDGTWNEFLTWQENTALDGTSAYTAGSTVEANIGFDPLVGDSANINLTGVLFDNSDQQGQNPKNEQYWGGNASLPFIPGGQLVAGFGIATDPNYPSDGSAYGAWGTGLTCGAGQPGAGGAGCNITINGLAMVDMFQTQGETQLAINGSAISIPGVQGSAAILTN